MTRSRMSLARFAGGALVGAVTSFSISVGLVPVVFAFAAILFVAIFVSRSAAFLSGSLIGWGGTWLVLSSTTYDDCFSRVPDCDPAVAFMPFLAVAAAIRVAGVALAIIGVAPSRGPLRPLQR